MPIQIIIPWDILLEIGRRVLCLIIFSINAAMFTQVLEFKDPDVLKPRLGNVPELKNG